MAAIDFTDRKTLLKFTPSCRRRRKKRPGPALIVVCLAGCALLVTVSLAAATKPANPLTTSKNQEDIEDGYGLVLQRLDEERERLMTQYRKADGITARRETLAKASALVFTVVEKKIIPFWYGTGYGFNGSTEIPGVGRIACGFFVVTVLRDAGFRVERVALSQKASELIIQSLVEEKNISRFSSLSGKEFLERLKKMPPGLYMLGLDGHVGFLSLSSAGAFFIHSTLLPPYSVVREPADSSRAVMNSAYRVLGCLSADERLIEKWLGGEKIAIRQ